MSSPKMSSEAHASRRSTLTSKDCNYSSIRHWASTRATYDYHNENYPTSLNTSPSQEETSLFYYLQDPICSINPQDLTHRENPLEDWAYVWNQLHKYSRHLPSDDNSLQEGSELMEKAPYTRPKKRPQPEPISSSWIWYKDPVKPKPPRKLERSYGEFMYSAYLPTSTCPPKTASRQRQKQHSVAKCRVWLYAHIGLLQSQ